MAKNEKFPLVNLSGGPDGRSTVLTIDGVEQKGVTHVSFDAGVRSAVEFVCERFAVLDVEVLARVRNRWDIEARLRLIGAERDYRGSGESLSEALRDIAALVGQDERNGAIRGQ